MALGGAGVRLLGADGRVRARWGTPADQLVVADHGYAVLLLAHGERTIEVHRLDLRTRQVRRWATLPAVSVARSFDGGLLVVTGRDGLAVLDAAPAAEGRVRTVWRELDQGAVLHGLQRSAEAMSVLAQGESVSVDGVPQLWTWALPGMALRRRAPMALVGPDGTGPLAVAVGAGTGLLAWYGPGEAPTLDGQPDGGTVRLWSAAGTVQHTYSDADLVGIDSAGPYLALRRMVRVPGESVTRCRGRCRGEGSRGGAGVGGADGGGAAAHPFAGRLLPGTVRARPPPAAGVDAGGASGVTASSRLAAHGARPRRARRRGRREAAPGRRQPVDAPLTGRAAAVSRVRSCSGVLVDLSAMATGATRPAGTCWPAITLPSPTGDGAGSWRARVVSAPGVRRSGRGQRSGRSLTAAPRLLRRSSHEAGVGRR